MKKYKLTRLYTFRYQYKKPISVFQMSCNIGGHLEIIDISQFAFNFLSPIH